ncbi:UNVERIFIED_CONTAM: hypothetical protein PYX00_002202 [Menopon gallinae]|uniref:Pacifastin domain-containing protein n=1 Tax=Menopon gallinae TaxID=328185 RepID=A0AAW2IGT1_9NEOP
MKILLLLLVVAAASACDPEPPMNYRIVNPFTCTPGSHFYIDCNQCSCGPIPEADVTCTRMACVLEKGQCIPGTYFNKDGMLCSCPMNGCKWDSNCFSYST